MPGRKWYVLAGAIFVVSFVAFVFFLFTRILGMGDAFDRFVVPGSAEVELEETGRYTVFHESISTLDGAVYRVGDVSGLEIEVVAEDGSPVRVVSPIGSMEYRMGGREGTAMAAFEVDEPGTYRISATYRGGEGPETVLAVARGFGTRIVTTVFGAIGLALGGTFLSVGIAVTTFVLRHRAKRRPPAVHSGSGRPPTVG